MKECYFADYTIGSDAYKNIESVCSKLGKRVLIVGGETALLKSKDKLLNNMTYFEIIDVTFYNNRHKKSIL